MKKVQIYIDETELELDEVPLFCSFSLSDFESTFQVIAHKTNQFKVPATPVNNSILGRLQELNTTDLSTHVARVVSDGVEFSGKVILYNSEFDGLRWWYPVQVVGGNGDWVKEIEDERLKDTDMAYCHHTLTASNVIATNTGTKDYIYDICDRGQEQKLGEFMLIDRYPAIRLRAIMESIFREKDIKLISNFLSSDYFNKKFLLFTQTTNQLGIDYKSEGFVQPDLFVSTYTQSVASGQQSITPFSGYSFVSSVVHTITEDEAVNNRFETSIRFRFYRPNTNVIFVCGGGYAGCGSNVTVSVYKNTTLLSSQTYNYSNAAWGSYVTINIKTQFVKCEVGENITVRIDVDGYFKNLTASPIAVNFEVDTLQGNTLTNYISAWFAEGATVTFDKVLPQDMSKKDFLKWLAFKYDLLFNYNSEERKLYCERRDMFFDSESIELTDAIDLGQGINIEHTIQPTNNVLEVVYRQDPTDVSQYHIRKQELYSTTVGNNMTSNGIERIEFEDSDTIFSRSIRLGFVQTYIPTLWGERLKKADTWFTDGALIYPEQRTDFNLRVLDFEALTVLPSGDSYKFEGLTYITYPRFSRESISDTIGENWQYQLKLRKQAKRLTCKMLLSDSQINNILATTLGYDLRTPVVVRLSNIADSLFTIEAIEDFNLQFKEPCTVRLVEAFILSALVTGAPSYLTDLGGGDMLVINGDGDNLINKGEGSQDELIPT